MDEAELAEELLRRLDTDGSFRRYVQDIEFLTTSALGRWLLEGIGFQASEVREPFEEMRLLTSVAAKAKLRLSPHGWAYSGRTPTSAAEEALRRLDLDEPIEAVEEVLVKAWNEAGRLEGCEGRVTGLAVVDPARMAVHHERARLVGEAVALHRAGRYLASVPIVLAQIDGIVLDVTENTTGFFVRRRPELLTDNSSVAGAGDSLAILQKLFNERQDSTGSTGRTSRHGVMHGRELGYDTLANSTKCFALLAAVTEWAREYLKQQP